MRVAIVGTGYMARVHARVVWELGGTVVGVCGRSLASATAFGCGDAYEDLPALLAEQRSGDELPASRSYRGLSRRIS